MELGNNPNFEFRYTNTSGNNFSTSTVFEQDDLISLCSDDDDDDDVILQKDNTYGCASWTQNRRLHRG